MSRHGDARTITGPTANLAHKCFVAVVCAFFYAGLCARAHVANAYPWMLKHGQSACSSCHVDPSGGELLTDYGRMVSDDELSSFSSGDLLGPSAGGLSEPFFGAGELASGFDAGGSIRLAGLSRSVAGEPDFRVFPMQLDLWTNVSIARRIALAASLGASRVPVGSPHGRAAQVTDDQGTGLNLISRTHWLAFDLGDDGETLLRFGRLNVPFGLRLAEHTSWVREVTQTDRESDQQHGVALALEVAFLRAEMLAILGNYQVSPDRFRERGFAAHLEFALGSDIALGLNTLLTTAAGDRLDPGAGRTNRRLYGSTLRMVMLRDLVVLAEADLLRRSRRHFGYVGFARVDYELLHGVHLLGTAEILDVGEPEGLLSGSAPGRGEPKLGGWLSIDWFPLTHFNLRLDAISRQDEPLQLLAQLHVYL